MTRLKTAIAASLLMLVPALALSAIPIADGTTPGELTNQSERLGDGTRVERYVVELAAGEQMDVTMQSTDFDAFLQLEGPHGDLLGHDDDSGGGLNAHIQMVAPEQGRYTILANSVEPGALGRFTLLVNRRRTGELVGSFSARLAREDRKSLRVVENPTHTVEVTAGQILDVIAASASFDTIVEIVDPGGRVVGSDDDGGGGTNSRARIAVSETGTYTIRVRSYDGSAGGAYRVVALAGDPQEMTVGGIGFDRAEVIEGSLGGALRSEARHEVELQLGNYVEVNLDSGDFDAVLYVFGPDGELIAEDDDSGGGSNARVSFIAEQSGEYTLQATSFIDGGSGNYRLRLQLDTDGSVQMLSGNLSNRSPRFADGTPYEIHEVDASAGERLNIRLNSDAFDAYLLVFDADDNKLAEDDDSGGGSAAQLRLTVPADGRYKVVANAYEGDATGDYQLLIRK